MKKILAVVQQFLKFCLRMSKMNELPFYNIGHIKGSGEPLPNLLMLWHIEVGVLTAV